ncbi:hypothetical protein J3E69DRAFT_359002 [Trichoderma sp. SZMC 28015]
MASLVLWGTREGRGGGRRDGTNREETGQPYRAPSIFQLHQITAQHSTAQHATTATTSPEHHAPCAPVLPEPLQFSPPLQPPSRELQIAMPWHKCKQASCTLTLCACPSHTSPPNPASGTSLTAWVTCKHCTCGGCHFLAFNVATVALEYNPIRSSLFDDRSSRYCAWRNSRWSRTFVPLTSSFA